MRHILPLTCAGIVLLCAAVPRPAHAEKPPLLDKQIVVGQSPASADAALAHARVQVTEELPNHRRLERVASECESLQQTPGGGWLCSLPVWTRRLEADDTVLWVVVAPRPHVLPTCLRWRQIGDMAAMEELRADRHARVVRAAHEVLDRGRVVVKAAGAAPDPGTRFSFVDRCFVLTKGDKVLNSGAYVLRESARLLTMPVMVVRDFKVDSAVFEVGPSFPLPLSGPPAVQRD